MITISQEAKAALIEALNGIEFHGDEGFDDAISFACEIVDSFPTSEESGTVSKSALIEALKEKVSSKSGSFDFIDGYDDGLHDAVMVVESFSTSDACATWIPVSERLPNSSGYFLISNGRYVSYSDYFNNKWYSPSEENPFVYTDVTHWKPLPTPPVTK